MRIYALAGILLTVAAVSLLALFVAPRVSCQTIMLASTTSTENSGLYDYLLPQFAADTGIEVQVIAVGTGRALNIAERGDADMLIVHDKASELEFIRRGYGIDRRVFMYNDYVFVGPRDDPARIAEVGSIEQVLQRISQTRQTFISRGDDSGTHKKELLLWQMAGITPDDADGWYLEVGRGMGAALNMANEIGAYTLSDRSTWISFNNRDNLALLFENQPPLMNPYSMIRVNPQRYPSICDEQTKVLADWLVSERGLALIRNFKVKGMQLFFTY